MFGPIAIQPIILWVESTVVQLRVNPPESIESISATALTVGVPAVRLLITAVVERSVSAGMLVLSVLCWEPTHMAARSKLADATPTIASASASKPSDVALSPPSNSTTDGLNPNPDTAWVPVEVGWVSVPLATLVALMAR